MESAVPVLLMKASSLWGWFEDTKTEIHSCNLLDHFFSFSRLETILVHQSFCENLLKIEISINFGKVSSKFMRSLLPNLVTLARPIETTQLVYSDTPN